MPSAWKEGLPFSRVSCPSPAAALPCPNAEAKHSSKSGGRRANFWPLPSDADWPRVLGGWLGQLLLRGSETWLWPPWVSQEPSRAALTQHHTLAAFEQQLACLTVWELEAGYQGISTVVSF